MAKSHSFNLSYFMFSLSMFLSLSSFIKANPNPLVSQICLKARNLSQCNKVLGSAPSTSDLKSLGYISINIALANAKQTSPFITYLSNKATDKLLKSKYETCVESYGSAIDDLKKSKTFLDHGDIPSLRTASSSAFDGPSNCDDAFEEPPTEPGPPAKLIDANKKLEDLVNILLVIGELLEGKKA